MLVFIWSSSVDSKVPSWVVDPRIAFVVVEVAPTWLCRREVPYFFVLVLSHDAQRAICRLICKHGSTLASRTYCVLWGELLASLCLSSFTCKMEMVMLELAFLESSWRKICMKVFGRWWRITQKSGNLFSGYKWWPRIYWSSHLQACILFSTLYLSIVATHLPTFLTLQSFKICPRFISVDLIFYCASFIDS